MPWLAAPERQGRAAARIVLTGFALGALRVATGTLDVAELISWAAREGNLRFTSLTLGMLIGGALLPSDTLRRWRAWLPGLPLALGVGVILSQVGVWSAVALGTGIGLLPSLVAGAIARLRRSPTTVVARLPAPSGLGTGARIVGVAVFAVAVSAGPIVIVTTGLGMLLAMAGWRAYQGGGEITGGPSWRPWGRPAWRPSPGWP